MAPLLPTLAAGARSLLSRAINSSVEKELDTRSQAPSIDQLGPLAARSILMGRSGVSSTKTTEADGHQGAIDPHNINNTVMFVLFGLIGVAFVVTGIWFFFWAKNGGFYFRENDWDDYKTTVLRRRGPNGTLLSGATESTKLGGGSIYKDVDDGATEYTGGLTQTHLSGETASTLSGITAGPSDIGAREKRRAKKEKRDREREKQKDRKHRGGRKVGEDGVLVDEMAEAEAKSAMRQYRHERPARVGGLNKESEGSQWDGSTNPSESTTAGSDLLSHRQSTPTNTPTKERERGDRERGDREKRSGGGGIRKVYSVADRNAAQEQERIRAEARRLQEKGRAASRRDFSFRQGAADSITEESADRSEVSGSAVSGGSGSDLGTKSYRHHIPGLSQSSQAGGTDIVDYAEERRQRRGAGYRRERRE